MTLTGWERAERSDPYYQACLAGFGLGGAAAGGIVGGAAAAPTAGLSLPALLSAGVALGLAAGYLACPYLAPMIRRKLESGAPLSSAELKSAAETMGRYANVRSAGEALKLLAVVRAKAPEAKNAQCAIDGPYAARQVVGRA